MLLIDLVDSGSISHSHDPVKALVNQVFIKEDTLEVDEPQPLDDQGSPELRH